MRGCIEGIVQVHRKIGVTWRDGGWAPSEAAALLRKGNLDRLASLAATLAIWAQKPPAEQEEGRLVLGWANLGALVEGTMTWFVCVHADSYAVDPLVNRNGEPIDPDDIWFAKLIELFKKQVLDPAASTRWGKWLDTVRERRNAIHAYHPRDVGSFRELRRAIRAYAEFLTDLQSRIPDEPDWR